jgi:hypothetical protein
MKNEYIYSKNNVTNSMDNILNYVLETAEKVMSTKDVEKRK